MELLAIVRAIQAVSGEVVLDSILEKMLGILIESSGAQTGALLIAGDAGLALKATATLSAGDVATDEEDRDRQAVTTLVEESGLDPDDACAPMVLCALVAAGEGTRVFEDVRNHPELLDDDPCLRDRGVRSLVCLPIQRHQSVVGVVCLTDSGRSGLFGEDTVELLELLGAQVAVSLENVGLFDDLWNEVTERKRVEDNLRQLNDQLEQRVVERTEELAAANLALERSNSELEQFAYAASHDLQEPLRVISGFSELLAANYGDLLDDAGRMYLGHMSRAALRMRTLVTDLLDYSRLTTRTKPPVEVPVGELLDEVWENLGAAVHESGAILTRDDDLPSVTADRSQFVRLLQNLVGNAVKYRGDDDPWVHVSGEQQGEDWVFGVADNGIGIAQTQHEAVFNIFRRLHGIDEYPGTGIGLASVKKIVERHGGRVWLESEVGQGSTFWFTWPAAPPGQGASPSGRRIDAPARGRTQTNEHTSAVKAFSEGG